MSVFNDVLNIIRLNVSVYHNARVCGDWRITEHHLGATCFHLPTQGDCLLNVEGEGEWLLSEGDIVIFPKELPHSMVPSSPQIGQQQHLPIAQAQGVAGTSMLCGSVKFQHTGGEHLMNLLPKVLVINADQTRDWLEPITKLILAESLQGVALQNPVLNRLCELLMVFSLRCFAEYHKHESNVLALYASSKLRHSIRAIHRNPAAKWTLSSLAKEAGMSRTSFSDLFTQVANMTAMQYLTWWRMQLAWSELVKGRSVDYVADTVGYQSDAAFSRAFKKMFGQTVGSVRAQSK